MSWERGQPTMGANSKGSEQGREENKSYVWFSSTLDPYYTDAQQLFVQ